jgi:glycosyltransferase involved in cell wall biosynthesis
VAYPFPSGADLESFGRGSIVDTTLWLDRLARREDAVAVPIGGGPCVFIRRDCLNAVGRLRTGLFAQGDGVLEDFCARARDAGWRNIALPGLFVGQRSQPRRSGVAWTHLRERNLGFLERLHPGFGAARSRTGELLAQARRRLDIARWRADGRDIVILVTHDDGGGVERRIEASVANHASGGRRAVVLRPTRLPDGTAAVTIDGGSYPNLCFALPRERRALQRLLRAARPVAAELHHFVNHDPALLEIIRGLGSPFDCHIHDYVWFCPRIALVGRNDRYCGEPNLAACESCVAELGTYLHERTTVAALRDRSRTILADAKRVIAPSDDAANRIARHFPGISPDVVPHEDDSTVPEPPPMAHRDTTVRICVPGAIGLHKGFHVLLACAEDAAKRELSLTFVVAGTTTDDQRLMDTGRVWVTGPYQPHEAVPLIRSQRATLAFLPSIWPETWCLALTEAWRAGLRAAAFDIGAQAERIRRTGRGFLIPTGLSAAAINDMLLQAAQRISLLPILGRSA